MQPRFRTGWCHHTFPSSSCTLPGDRTCSARVLTFLYVRYSLWMVTDHECNTSDRSYRHTGQPNQGTHGVTDKLTQPTKMTTVLCGSLYAASRCQARRRPAPCERHEAACCSHALDRLLHVEEGGLQLDVDALLDDAGDDELGHERAHQDAHAQRPARRSRRPNSAAIVMRSSLSSSPRLLCAQYRCER